ncbi:MAG: prepilin-type N-terminal cleavage/methylation domain-containing protein [Phycisphaerales bacterium]|nr:prepilin-type N-terminal cleavage/methylation domain-containing protein [Phycisphaerales bacterium]
MRPGTRSTPPTLRRGFSLVEVLVAVLVLALGLLGLGAVFPMVVRQQRLATETTLGLSAMNAAERVLFNNDNFKLGGRGWAALRDYAIQADGLNGNWVAVEADIKDGSYVLPDPAGGPDIILPLSQRLFPLPFTTQDQPRFVWDLGVRFIPDPLDPGNAEQPIMVAMYLRPIDPGIRPGLYKDVATGDMLPYSLVNSLVGTSPVIALKDRRNPVSVDSDGRPTLDGRRSGRSEYSWLSVVDMGPPHGSGSFWRRTRSACWAWATETRSRISRSPSSCWRSGQRFIGRTGQIYKVIGWKGISKRGIDIKVAPGLTDADGDGTINPRYDLNPVIFVPQGTPVDPKVFTITP